MARFKAFTASFLNAHADVCAAYINQRKSEIFPYVWKSTYFISSKSLTNDKSGSRDSVDCIATRHDLDGQGIELRWVKKFYAPRKTGHAAYPASYAMRTESFPGVKRSGRVVENANAFLR